MANRTANSRTAADSIRRGRSAARDAGRRPAGKRALPGRLLARLATEAVSQGVLSATERAALLELVDQYGSWLDRHKSMTYRMLGARLGRHHRTMVRSMKTLQGAGFVRVNRHYGVVDGHFQQLPPTFTFPPLHSGATVGYLLVMARLRGRAPAPSESDTASPNYLTMHKTRESERESGAVDPVKPSTTPGRLVTAAEYRAYAAHLRGEPPPP